MSDEEAWVHFECERALYVDRGRAIILCDRELPKEWVVQLTETQKEQLRKQLS